jgi:hypothetical protein
VTWLPVDIGDAPERDAVLSLKEEPYAAMQRVLAACWSTTDAMVLDLCRRRLAETMGARAEVAGADVEPIAEQNDLERAAVAFAEQYHYDHRLLANGPGPDLESRLSRGEFVNFVWALHMNDAYLRLLTLLDIAPDPPGRQRPERTASVGTRWETDGAPAPASAEDTGRRNAWTLMRPEFAEAYSHLNPRIVKQSLVDEVTSEAIRLRNASYQGCLY